MDSDCIFCKIIKGETESSVVYEDSDILAFLDKHPINLGHTLVIPKKHSVNIYDIPSEELQKIAKVTQELSIKIKNYHNSTAGITRKDIKEKTDLWEKLGDERIIKHLQNPSLHNWVAKNNGVVVGFVAVKKSQERNQIAALHILPDFQGQGIGTELL